MNRADVIRWLREHPNEVPHTGGRSSRIAEAEAEVRRCEIDVVSAARMLIDTRPGEQPDRVFVNPDAVDHLRLVVGDLDRAMAELARLRVTP